MDDVYINSADPPVLATYAPYFRPDRLSEPFFYRLCWIFEALQESYRNQSGASTLKVRITDERLLIVTQLIERELRKCMEYRVPHSLDRPFSSRSDVHGRRWKEHSSYEWGWHHIPSFRDELAYLRRRLTLKARKPTRANAQVCLKALDAMNPLEKRYFLDFKTSQLLQIASGGQDLQSQKFSAWLSTSEAVRTRIILEGGGPPFNPKDYDWAETLSVIRRLEWMPSERRGRPEDTHLDDFVFFAVRMHRCISDGQFYSSGWSKRTPLVEFLDAVAKRYGIGTGKPGSLYRIKDAVKRFRSERVAIAC